MSGISRLVRSATLYGYPELAASLGLNAHTMLRQVGLSPQVLLSADTPIPVDRVRQLLELSAQTCGKEDFGLRLAAGRRLSNLGHISVVLREEPSAIAALEVLRRYLRLINASLLLQIDYYPDVIVIREDIMVDHAAPVRQSVELAVGVMYRFLKEIVGPAWTPRRVCFAHRAPKDTSRHTAFLGKSIEFGAEFNGIACYRAELEAPLPNTDAGAAQQVRNSLEKALALSPASVSEPIRQLVAALLPMGRCTADQVARHLGVDRRTVHRLLAKDGESFRGLHHAVRVEYAIRQLRDSDHTITEVAHLLGFSGASAFAHWFKNQFGQSAAQWRAAANPPA